MLRRCKGCGLEAHSVTDLDMFVYSKSCKHDRTLQCKACKKKQDSQYEYNPKRHKKNEYRRALAITNKVKAMEMFDFKCNHCGIIYNGDNEVIFDFHHLDPQHKESHIGSLLGQQLFGERTMKEIKKCIMLCSNCHRLEHKRLRNV